MKSTFPKFVAASLVLVGGAASADILAGIGWAANQAAVVCYVFNAGSGPVDITSKAIVNEVTGNAYPAAGSCTNSLASGRTCALTAAVQANGANTCKFVLSPSGADVRGQMEVRNSTGTILNSIGLR
ncbi:hypothetical protein WKW79_07630 [Variovorax robiniae]|uniref:DUF4189 domain-containing protein n=1 Tax=Variovorax robiniae TaxID=1836199 RepID=A0ABU8X3P9_9BURK